MIVPPVRTIILVPAVRGVEPAWCKMVAKTSGSPASSSVQMDWVIFLISDDSLPSF
jgi:hypothetical protein